MSRPVEAPVMDMKFPVGLATLVSRAPEGRSRWLEDDPLGLLQASVLVKLVDSTRNSALSFSRTLKFL